MDTSERSQKLRSSTSYILRRRASIGHPYFMNATLTLGEYIRRLRRSKGWQLQRLATETGLSLTHLSRIENDNAVPNAESVVRLAGALDGDLTLMLEMADCLPREILERLIDRASDASPALHRSAGTQEDPGYAQALVEDLDPPLRSALTIYFGFSEPNVEGLVAMLRAMARLEPDERDQTIASLVSLLAVRIKEERT